MKENIKNHKNKIIITSIIVVLAIVSIITVSYTMKVKAAEEAKRIKIENIEKTNNEIDKLYSEFEKEEDRNNKLIILSKLVKDLDNYEKSETHYSECEKEYNKKIDLMKKFFNDDYDNSVNTIKSKVSDSDDLSDVNDKDLLNNTITEFNTLKETIKNEYENYKVISEDRFNELNSSIDTITNSYNTRIEEIKAAKEAEAARIAAEEEAKRKAEEEAAAAAASKSNKSNGSSNGSNNGGNSNYSSSNSGSSNNYSGGSSDNSYSGGSSSSSGGSSNSSSNNDYKYEIWIDNGNGKEYYYQNGNGDIYDSNGGYIGNMNGWDGE